MRLPYPIRPLSHFFRAASYLLLPLTLAGFTTYQDGGHLAPPSTSKINVLALNQPPCATLSPNAVVTAKLTYQLGEQEQSEHGFAVSIKFATTDPRRTFSLDQGGQQAVTQRHDTLTLHYQMNRIWSNPQLKRPITCYFYLHRNTGNGRSTVIARTPPIVFQECQ